MAYLISRLYVSFEAGIRVTQAQDIGLDKRPTETVHGGKLRGLGTHFVSAEAEARAKRLGNFATMIRNTFARRLPTGPLPGTFLLTHAKQADELLDSLDYPRDEITARVAVYEIAPQGALPEGELLEWIERIKAQMDRVPLGHGKIADGEGVEAFRSLAECPAFSEKTRESLSWLVERAAVGTLSRVEFKRRAMDLEIEIASPTSTSSAKKANAPVREDDVVIVRRKIGLGVEGKSKKSFPF